MGRIQDAREKLDQARVEQSKQGLSQDELAEYGRLILEEICAGKTIRIYERGFVRVSGLLGKKTAPFERLSGISNEADVTKKSGLGRALAAGATLGANLVLSPNKRGDMYLAISTDRTTHMLHMSPPTEGDLKAMHKIVTAGQSVMALSATHGDGPAMAQAGEQAAESLADELRKLAALRQEGLLSEEEFESAKKKLLK